LEPGLINRTTGKPVWRVVLNPWQPKPYVYPLATLDGVELTANSPADHVWHHSLWFAWKYINGVNYWEVNKQTGRGDGLTLVKSSRSQFDLDCSGRVEMEIEYAPAGEQHPLAVLRETRVLAFPAPRPDGSYAIDWDATFTACGPDLTFDRTPPKATSGGYAGLSLRFPKGVKGWSFLTSERARSAKEGNGKPARWVDFSGPAGANATPAGIAVFDHPANPRHPTPWYLNESHPYYSPAPIYHEPLTLKAGATLRLRYRVLVHPGAGDTAALEREWQSFTTN
jgi:hypothetical protein